MKNSLLIASLCAAAGCSGPLSEDSLSGAPVEVRCGPESPVGLEPGDCAPNFILPDAQGQPVSLQSFRGKVALVDISALW